jgi:hypothetical protein
MFPKKCILFLYNSGQVTFNKGFKTAKFPVEYFIPNISELSAHLTHLSDLSVTELQQDTLQEFVGEVHYLTVSCRYFLFQDLIGEVRYLTVNFRYFLVS